MEFDLTSGFEFTQCGIFTSPSEKWKHDARICDTYEIFYVADGALCIQADETRYELRKNQYLITRPGCYQAGWRESCCRFYWFHFRTEGRGEEYPASGLFASQETVESYYYILNRHMWDARHGGLIIAALLSELLTCEQKRVPVSDLCYMAKEYIKAASVADLSVEKVAAHFKYSTRYFSTLFRCQSGINLSQYIFDELMLRAKYLLKNTSMRISEIGLRLGYSDGQNFSHAFKKAFGISPGQYRKRQTAQTAAPRS